MYILHLQNISIWTQFSLDELDPYLNFIKFTVEKENSYNQIVPGILKSFQINLIENPDHFPLTLTLVKLISFRGIDMSTSVSNLCLSLVSSPTVVLTQYQY